MEEFIGRTSKGQWVYYYRAVDKTSHTVDFCIADTRDKKAARRFFEKAINRNAFPHRVTLDKNSANVSGLSLINQPLPERLYITIRQSNYLNNVIEQYQWYIKRVTYLMLGLSYDALVAPLTGIELSKRN